MQAFKVNAVDTLGAGDVFHGAFAFRLVETGDLIDGDAFRRRRCGHQMHALRRADGRGDARRGRRFPQAELKRGYFFDGQGAPQGAQAPAKSSGDTARPLDGLTR